MHSIRSVRIQRPRRRALRLGVALSAALVTSLAGAAISFTDVSGAAKVNLRGESYGASWGDLNGDGYPDLFASNHRQQPSLFLNRGNGVFYETAPQVLTWRNRPGADTHGASWADIDNDGDQDLVVSTGTGNLSHVLVNENQRLVDRTRELGLTNANVGGRLPVWLDYDGNKLPDFVMTQYGGIARLYRQTAGGSFTDETLNSKLVCARFHYGQLLDVTNDGRLDFICPSEAAFPQKIYDTAPMPWQKLFDSAAPNGLLPLTPKVVDSVIADFDNNGRMDMFLLGGVQLRPSSVVQSSATHFESQLAGGTKGFKFKTAGTVKITPDWNSADEQTATDLGKIKIGAGGYSPAQTPFWLDPGNPAVVGMPPEPTHDSQIPQMRIGYDPAKQQWTLVIQTKLTTTSKNKFSEAYLQVDSTAPISGLFGTGFWPSDKAARPTLLMNYSGGFGDQTVEAGLGDAVQCVSATAGDFDNDGDVDLYLACRSGASNLPNILYENTGGGNFRTIGGAGGAAGPVGIAVESGAGTADSVVAADYDVDGFLDLFVTNGFNLRPLRYGGVNKLFRNDGNGNHWVQVDLVGRNSDRDAVGARIYATAGGKQQLRVQNGAYHRWSQDLKRAHFGLGGATLVDLRIEWPSGSVQTFNDVAVDRLYEITEGGGIVRIQPGVAPAYQCGPPPLSGAKDVGVFIWRDCPSGEWRMKTVSGGGSITYAGRITSGTSYQKVTPQGLEAEDSLDFTTDPKQIVFRFVSTGTGTDGVNFIPQDRSSACLSIGAPTGVKVYVGPFREPVQEPFNLDTQKPC